MLQIAFAFVLLLFSSVAHAEKRVALVIGNSAYKHAGVLANPRNDAADMSAALKKRGFQVIEGYDLEKAGLDRKIRDFATALQGADVGLFFFAGHGLQVAGQNYIVPVDAELTTAAALDFEMVRLDLVHRTMEREAPTNIIFLDACRNNPLARNLARALGTRSIDIGRGLAAVESGSGTLISFSTQPGNVASDGSGRNSPFTGPLVKHIASSNEDLSAVLIAVRNDVMSETKRKQVPWEHSALTKRIYFSGAAPATVAQPPTQLSEASREWSGLDKSSVPELETFLRRHGSSPEADYARARLEQLKKQQVAAALPPDPPKTAPPPAPKLALSAPPQPATPTEEQRLDRVRALGDKLKGAVFVRNVRMPNLSMDHYIIFLGGLNVRVEERDPKTRKVVHVSQAQISPLSVAQMTLVDDGKNRFHYNGPVELASDGRSIRVLVSSIQNTVGDVWIRQ